MIFFVLSLLKKRKRKRKYWLHLMLRLHREEGEFHLLKELWDYHSDSKFTGFWCFGSNTRATYLKEDHQFPWTNCSWTETGSMSKVWTHTHQTCIGKVRARHWNQLRGSELSKHLWKCLLRMQKMQKSNLIQFFYDGRKFQRQYVNMTDTTRGHIYFLTCENFGLSVQWPLVQTLFLSCC